VGGHYVLGSEAADGRRDVFCRVSQSESEAELRLVLRHVQRGRIGMARSGLSLLHRGRFKHKQRPRRPRTKRVLGAKVLGADVVGHGRMGARRGRCKARCGAAMIGRIAAMCSSLQGGRGVSKATLQGPGEGFIVDGGQ
jgi:hypothetical protein